MVAAMTVFMPPWAKPGLRKRGRRMGRRRFWSRKKTLFMVQKMSRAEAALYSSARKKKAMMMACRVSLRVRPGVVSVAMMLTTVMTMGRALTPQSRPSGRERSGIIRQGWPCSWVSPRIM